MRTTILFAAVFSMVLLSTATVHSQNNAATDAINKLIDKYSALESAGDMVSQAKLMTKDRVWVGGTGGRRRSGVTDLVVRDDRVRTGIESDDDRAVTEDVVRDRGS